MLKPEQIVKHLDKFTSIYVDGKVTNPLPEKGRYMVYCKGNNDRGFVYNTNANKIGLQALIAVSWIKATELRKLIKS